MQDDQAGQVDTASSAAALATVDAEPEVATGRLPAPVPASVAPPGPDRTLHSDPHDFAGLYIRHRSSFTLHARRYLSDARDAEEVVQEAFLRLFLALPELETELQALAYCRRTITNLCIDRYRAQARRPRLVDLDSVRAEDLADDDTDDPVVRAEDAAVVRDALSMLSPLHRAALVKREIEEKPLPVIAGELEIPEDSVKHVLFRARRALRRLLTATSVAPGADDAAGLGLARAGSGGLAALILLVGLGLGSGRDLTAIPVVGDDLPDMPGVTDLAKAVGNAVEDISRAVTSSVGAPEGVGGSAGGPAGQGGGGPVRLGADGASPTSAPAVPQDGPAALPPSPAGSPAPDAAGTSRPLLAPVQGDARHSAADQPDSEQPDSSTDPGTEGAGTDPEAEPSDAATGTAERAPTPARTPRHGEPGSVDATWPSSGPVAAEVPGAAAGRPSQASAEPAASPRPKASPAAPTSPDLKTPPAVTETGGEPRPVSSRTDPVERRSEGSAGSGGKGAVGEAGGRAPAATSPTEGKAAPARPGAGATPATPGTARRVAQPAPQVHPVTPAPPVKPAKPAPPVKPGKAVKSDKAVGSDKGGVKPAKPVQPEKPVTVSALVQGSPEVAAAATDARAAQTGITGTPDAASRGQRQGTLARRLLGTPAAPAS